MRTDKSSERENGMTNNWSSFGNCPRCESVGFMVSMEHANWLICDDCQVYWFLGAGFDSNWDTTTWPRIEEKLTACEEVEPLLKEKPEGPAVTFSLLPTPGDFLPAGGGAALPFPRRSIPEKAEAEEPLF